MKTKTVADLAASLSDNGMASKLKEGRGSCNVFKILHMGRDAVVKIGVDDIGRAEISSNLASYSEMEKINVARIVAPKIFENNGTGDLPYIIMEYLGKDFRTNANQDNIMDMTRTMIDRLKEVYISSIELDHESSKKWLEGRRSDLIRYFTVHLIPFGFGSISDIDTLKRLDIVSLAPKYIAWATRDFTPDNIFINGDRLTYIDGKGDARGVPLLDLAMFTTLTGEVYGLPNGVKSAEAARSFAMEIGKDLLRTPYSEELFKLGEAFQYSLSVRFRKEKDQRSPAFVESIRRNLNDIIVATKR
ncbi:MAG: hypothetical protein KGH61_02050 [Candidatus Micrarchaeota archaeon]|nr:hypothetical protein [Candidatus Micrarchaeota archaeon]